MDMSGLPGQYRADPGEPGGMKVTGVATLPGPVLAPPSLALGLGGPVLHESVPTPRGCEGSRGPPHPACTQ